MAEQAATIRPARVDDAAAMARVHLETWRTTYRGIVPNAYLDTPAYAERETMWRRILSEFAEEHVAYVAEVPEVGVVGIASGGPPLHGDDGFAAELHVLYVLAEHQRRGLGRRLTAAVVADLIGRGKGSLIVWVLAANPSRGFYEGLGGRYVRAETTEIGGAALEEVAYGWDDARPLLDLARESH
jgi:ribosomal protein S18 acetylase RimI-like enzyme